MRVIFKFLIATIFIVSTSFVPTQSKYERQLEEIENNLIKAQQNLDEIR